MQTAAVEQRIAWQSNSKKFEKAIIIITSKILCDTKFITRSDHSNQYEFDFIALIAEYQRSDIYKCWHNSAQRFLQTCSVLLCRCQSRYKAKAAATSTILNERDPSVCFIFLSRRSQVALSASIEFAAESSSLAKLPWHCEAFGCLEFKLLLLICSALYIIHSHIQMCYF